MEFDVKDKKLLYELDLNARLGTSQLGKHIGLSQEAVHYRIKRLEGKGIITGFNALINFGLLGYTGYGVYARFHNVTKKQKEEIINSLKKEDRIYWIASFGGRFDLAFAIMAKSIIEFNEIFMKISAKYSRQLKDLTIAIRIELTQFPRDYLFDKKIKSDKEPKFGKYKKPIKIDELDESVLKLLANDARASALKISDIIESPASTVGNRLKRLEKKEIIQGYSAQINCQEFDYQSYQLFIKTNSLTKEKKQKLLSYCQSHKNIIFHIETIGQWNLEIIYEVKDQRELQEMIMELRTKFADLIQDVESTILFNHYIKYNQYPIK